MSESTKTLEQLASLPRFHAGIPATDAEVRRIESELDVDLPPQYIEFLRRFGYARWYGQVILGLRPIDSSGRPSMSIADCVSVTKRERQADNPIGTARLPQDHVVIATDGGGGNYVLFTVGSPNEGKVFYYNFEDRAEPIQEWETLQDFLKHEILAVVDA